MRNKTVFKAVVMMFLCVVSVSAFAINTSFEEMVKQTSVALKEGNAKKLSATFDNNVNLSLKREEGSFTKFQAELLLNDFFRTNKAVELKEVQRANNASTSFVVFSLKTSSKNYRVFVKFVQSSKEFKIAEVRID